MATVIATTERDRDIFQSQVAARNQELRNAIVDSEGSASALHSELTEEIQRLKQRWSSACDYHSQLVQAYQTEMKLPAGSIVFSQEELSSALKLALSVPFIEQYGPVSTIPSIAALAPQFELVRAKGLRLKERNELTDAFTPVIKSVLPLDQFEYLETILKMNDLHHSDPLGVLKAEFTRLFQEMASVEAQLSQVSEEREAALRSADILKAEERGALILALFDKLLEIVRKRTEKSEAHAEQVKDFHSNLEAFFQNQRLGKGAKATATLIEDTTADVNAIEAGAKAATEQRAKDEETFDQESKAFRRNLVSNTSEQIKAWDDMLVLMGQIPSLQQQRVELVAEQLRRIEQHQHAVAKSDAYLAACEQRLQESKTILANAKAAAELLQRGVEYMDFAKVAIHNKDVDAQLAAIQKEEKVRYYDVYRRYVLYAGEQLHRKQQRLENNKRMIRSTEFQIAHAVESLDPDLNLYKEQLTLLKKKESELQATIQEIQSGLQREAVGWSPIEAALETLEVTVEPPALLLQELQRDLTQQHATAVDELTTTEQKAVDQEKNVVRKLQNACVAAKATIEERRATRQAALSSPYKSPQN